MKNKLEPDFRPALMVTRYRRLHPDAQKCDATNEVTVQAAPQAKTPMPV
jgi:hypothetical protein